jgi:DNA (cytosine-5)-methyltransferase 1
LGVLDLFSGIGGFSLGLERAGFRTISFCEVLPKPRHLLNHYWPDTPCYDDVNTLTGERLAADGIVPDALCGGFPCQDLSYAGKGAGLDGARSGLWFQIARLLRELRDLGRPVRFVILENVSALLGRGLGVVLGDLAALGYDAEWDCIPASAVGAPHQRDRIWIVAYPRGEQHEGFGDAFRRALAQELSEAALAHASGGGSRLGRAGSDAQPLHGGEIGAVADAAGELRDGRGLGAEPSGRDEPANGGPHLADADQQHHVEGLIAGVIDAEERRRSVRRSAGSCGDGLGWWATEPDVGRVAHGVPAGLDEADGAIQEHDPEAGAKGDRGSGGLPSVRSDGAAGAASSGLRESGSGRGALPALSCESGPAGRHTEGEADQGLHDLRRRVHPDAQQEAHDLQLRMSRGSWSTERPQALGWAAEPNVPRVANGVSARVDRLHGLGNAVVPEIPYRLGRAILTAIAAEPLHSSPQAHEGRAEGEIRMNPESSERNAA